MQIEEIWEDFTSSEKEIFQRSCRKLLKQTFIVRDKDEEHKRLYYFISKRPEVFSTYLSYIGFDIMMDRENGVIMLRNYAGIGENGKVQASRLALKKAESIVLCCLWTLYAERLRTGTLTQNIIISITELNFALEKYNLKDAFDKTTMTGILSLLSRYCLIDEMGKVGNPECKIVLYPSLQFAMDLTEFAKFAEHTEKRMFQEEGEENEEEDDDAE